MNELRHIAHLTRRFLGSLSRREPSAKDVAWAHQQLSVCEAELWDQMAVQDRRHSIVVAQRFAAMAGEPTRAQLAGALLHDVGKSRSQLGTFGRVVATIVGPRSQRFRQYHDHEMLGLELLRTAGSDVATLALIDGTDPLSTTLRAADTV